MSVMRLVYFIECKAFALLVSDVLYAMSKRFFSVLVQQQEFHCIAIVVKLNNAHAPVLHM